MYKLKCLFFFFAVLYSVSVKSQLVVPALDTAITIDFTGFAGAGFSPTPAVGQLDSDTWSIKGLSDGNLYFGGTQTTASTDFTRGTNAGTTTTGGIWAFSDNGNIILGTQPTGTDFNPGEVVLRIENKTGFPIRDLNISYGIFIRNGGGRASTFNFSHSNDTLNYTAESQLSFTTTEVADATPVWISYPKTITLYNLNIPADGFYYLRWTSADVSGSGSRDKVGLDNIAVRGSTPPIVAEFTANNVCLGDSTKFTDLSSSVNGEIVRWSWLFDDGSANSTDQHPIHIYTASGSYIVVLEVENANGDISYFTKIVEVYPVPVAGFSASAVFGCSPVNVAFTDTSSIASGSITGFKWYFNSSTSITQSSSYVFITPGIYNVTLKVTSDQGCTDSITKIAYVNVFETPLADFNFSIDSLTVNVIPNFSGGSTPYSIEVITFGDGTTSSTGLSHTYSQDGNYNICVSIIDSNGCSASACKTISIGTTGVLNFKNANKIILYPNPSSSGVFNLKNAGGFITVYNIVGEVVHEQVVTGNDHLIDLSLQNAGTYFVKIKGGSMLTIELIFKN